MELHDRRAAGACEAADSLSSRDKLEKKLEQVFKEAVAIWYYNAKRGCHDDVKMLLTDGIWFMFVL